ncbi:MAG: hypothetical protein ACI9K2_007606 [Myxococcota bacterium]
MSTVATRLRAVSPWVESMTVGGPAWYSAGEGESAQSHRFALSSPRSVRPTSTDTGGWRRADGISRTDIRLDWRVMLPAGDQVPPYYTALDDETDLVAACLSSDDMAAGIRISEMNAERRILTDPGGQAIAVHGVVTFLCLHTLARGA